MRIIVTKNELVALGNIALTSHNLTKACLLSIEESMCEETIAMTDNEVIQEIVNEAISNIEMIGGSVDARLEGEYLISIPEAYMVEELEIYNEVAKTSRSLIIKAFKFGYKHAQTYKTLISYIKASAETFGALLTNKEIIKDFVSLEVLFEETSNKIKSILNGGK